MLRVERWFLVVSLAVVSACTDVEGRCEAACDAAERCDAWHPDDCVDYCVEHYEDSSDDCQEEFEYFTDCLDENESCDAIADDCSAEYFDTREECDWFAPPDTIEPQ
jgi:hypothetical protein